MVTVSLVSKLLSQLQVTVDRKTIQKHLFTEAETLGFVCVRDETRSEADAESSVVRKTTATGRFLNTFIFVRAHLKDTDMTQVRVVVCEQC